MDGFGQRRFTLTVAAQLMALSVGLASCSRSLRADEAAALPLPADDGNTHTVNVQFDYDFGKNPSCAEKPALKTCIKQFDVYDVSGQRFRLFTIPVPKDARGLVKGITGKSPSRAFMPGTHFISVTAEDSRGIESETSAARIKVEVKAKPTEDKSNQTK
jgi:hypothetical protein